MPEKSSLQEEERILAHPWRTHHGREGTQANTVLGDRGRKMQVLTLGGPIVAGKARRQTQRETEGGKCGCSHLGGGIVVGKARRQTQG